MLEDNVKILHTGKSIVLNFYNTDRKIDSMLVEIAVYYNGKLSFDQVMTLPYSRVFKIYEDLKWGNENKHIVDGPLEEGWKIVKTPNQLRSYLILTKREIYDILLKGHEYYYHESQ